MSLTGGLSTGLTRGMTGGLSGAGAGVDPFAYVDSVNGNDANPGTFVQPVKTLAAVAALPKAAVGIGFLRGSTWRETGDFSALPNANLFACGSGDSPAILGADVVSTWTAEGTANVWQATVANNITATGRFTVYEDGVLMTPVADVATCSATAGSYVVVGGTSPATNKTMKIRPTSGDPNSNGKVYTVSVRMNAYFGASGQSATGLILGQAGNNDGAIALSGCTSMNITASMSKWGTKHNITFGSGTLTDFIAYKYDNTTAGEPSSNIVEGYIVGDAAGNSLTTRRTFCIGRGATIGGIIQSSYSHGNTASLFDSSLREQCAAVDVPYDSYFGTNSDVIDGLFSKNCRVFPAEASTLGTVRRSMVISPSSGGTSNLTKTNYTDCAFYLNDRTTVSNGNEVLRPQGSYSLTNCSFAGLTIAGYTNIMANASGTATVSINKTVFIGGGTQIWLGSSHTYTGNYNVFFARNTFDSGRVFSSVDTTGTTRTTLAAWQASTGQDSQSVVLAAADQSGANKFWLNDPSTGDWRVNPLAKVYDSAGNAYIGTFPDGTSLQTVGPQTYWHWNNRASTAGPPQKNPTVPLTEAECATYIAAPTSWNFYP